MWSVWMRTRRAMVAPMLVITREISGGTLMSKDTITNGRLWSSRVSWASRTCRKAKAAAAAMMIVWATAAPAVQRLVSMPKRSTISHLLRELARVGALDRPRRESSAGMDDSALSH